MSYGGLLLGGARKGPLQRNRTAARINMNELANAEYQALHLQGKSAEAFRKSAYGHVMERNREQLNRYHDTYNDETLPIYLEREYLYGGPSRRASTANPHLAHVENPKRVVAHYALAMKAYKKGHPEKLEEFAAAYPEVAGFYSDRILAEVERSKQEGYIPPKPRRVNDFGHIARMPNYSTDFPIPIDGKILNPDTNQFIKVNGALGKRLLRRYEFGTGHGLQGMGYY